MKQAHHTLLPLLTVGFTLSGITAGSAANPDYRNLILGDNPIVYYEFDETSGTEVANSATTGTTYTGTISGAINLGQTSFSASGGTAVDFAGGFINSASAITNSMTEWSLEAWVNYSSDKTSDSHIIANDQGGWNDDVMFGINPEGGLLGAGGGTIGAGQQDNASQTRDFVGSAMTADTWHHVVVTASNTANELLVYIDGSLAASNTTNANSIWTFNGADGFGPAPPLVIGAKRANGGNVFDGLLDEVAIYDLALDATAIAAHYNAGSGVVSGPKDLIITKITLSPDSESVELTWGSKPGEEFFVKYSTDLTNWDADLDDGVIADAGDSTTRTFGIAGIAGEGGKLFFRVEKK
ncbi:LamG domain-containing protein [bacterium]|nr:LamG domain-containing protein [bacterium]